jgi:hypothetical protein
MGTTIARITAVPTINSTIVRHDHSAAAGLVRVAATGTDCCAAVPDCPQSQGTVIAGAELAGGGISQEAEHCFRQPAALLAINLLKSLLKQRVFFRQDAVDSCI